MRLPDFTRSTTFRWTLAVSGAFIACMLLMFGFILAQAHSYMTADVDALVSEIANTIASHEPQQRILGLDQYLRADPNRVKLGGLFAADGSRIAGNIETLPPALHADAGAQLVSLVKIHDEMRERYAVRAVARRLPEGGTLVIARSDYEFTWIVHIVERALAVGLIPALCLSLAVGAFLSIRAQKRIEEVNSKIQRIV
ncbi:MAG: two-component sensor histidine kinase, partial [Xanthobacteraceae bacterium]